MRHAWPRAGLLDPLQALENPGGRCRCQGFHPICASDRALAEGEGRGEVDQVGLGVRFLPRLSESIDQT